MTQKPRETYLPLVVETQQLSDNDAKKLNNEINDEEKSIIISSLILMKDEDSLQTGMHDKFSKY